MKNKDQNIAIFTPNQNPYSETFIQAHKNYLQGNIFYYYGSGDSIQLENGSISFSRIVRYRLKLIQKLFHKPSSYLWEQRILTSLKNNKIDVILVEYGTHAHHLLPIIKKSGLPFVVHFHGYDASVKKVIENCDNYKDVFQTAKKVIGVSRKMEAMLLELGCPNEKLVCNACSPQPEFAEVQPVFAKKQFISLGRFTDKKAPYYTLLAFAQVAKTHTDVHLVMAGDGALLNTCRNLAHHLVISSQVSFPGVITPEQFRGYLTESLAFVQHSITADNGDMEGTPVAVLEASLAGLPVISTNHAGIPDVVIDGVTGLLCEEHDVDAMARNMITLINDPEIAKQLGSAGKKYITDNFSLDRHIQVLQEVLKVAAKT